MKKRGHRRTLFHILSRCETVHARRRCRHGGVFGLGGGCAEVLARVLSLLFGEIYSKARKIPKNKNKSIINNLGIRLWSSEHEISQVNGTG